MEKRELEIGDVLQITAADGRPDHTGWFLVVTEPKDFGAMGYILSPYEDMGLVRFKGVAYLRVKFEEVEYVGKAPLVLQREKEEENAV